MSWPWKKKSSDKAAVEKVAAILDSAGVTLATAKPRDDQEKYKKPNYVQISLESYSHLTGLENHVKTCEEQVQTLEDQIKELDEQLSAAQSEVTTKDNLVKQHSKVAEEAVSGWEKAEAEALALKNHLETVTLDKLTAEDRASHLDGALKECMRQIRSLKEEHEKNLQEVALTKTKQLEMIKGEFEAKIGKLDQELLKSAAENAALSRSLQERSNILIKVSEEKSHAEAEIELLKSNIGACEREINSLKYELHVVTKELEIRNEEKNMSIRSAEVANKQHMEGVKKIAKLEAECQRLRGLVRKKLPGPATLAQMKLEAENLGRDQGDSSLRRSPVKPPGPRMPSSPDYSFDNYQKFHKENEFLTERLLATEEETKMLKEALAKRNSELQASRTLCAKTSSKLQLLEVQIQGSQNPPKSSACVPAEASLSHNASNPPSLTSMSEDGNDDERSCAESWPSASMSELSQFNKEKNIQRPKKADTANHLELMDDFLEMEKLACSSNRVNGSPFSPDSGSVKRADSLKSDASGSKDLDTLENPNSFTEKQLLVNLETRISAIFKSISKEEDMRKALEDIKQAVFEVCNSSQECQEGISPLEENNGQGCSGGVATVEKNLKLSIDAKQATESHHMMTPDLEAAIIQIHDFILFLGKEAVGVHNASTCSDELDKKIEIFSVTYKKVISSDANLFDFILELSYVLAKARDLKFNILGYKCMESEVNSPDYIDKVALPENKVVQVDPMIGSYQSDHAISSYLTSHPEDSDDGNLGSGNEANADQHTVLSEDYGKLRSDNDNLTTQLARTSEDLESMKSKVQETEKMLAEVKSQLASAQNSYSLAETQLKCMAESYRLLETRAQELETEVNLLRVKTESLDIELQEEKKAHQYSLDRSKDLQEQLERMESSAQESDADIKGKQEIELAAAAEKLAECQETIFLLGKQLNALRPPNTDIMGFTKSEKGRKADSLSEYQPTTSGMNSQQHSASAFNSDQTSAESPVDLYSFPGSLSETDLSQLLRSPVDSKQSKHRPTLSGSSASCSTPEKQTTRSFSRFFSSSSSSSSKGKYSAY
ncbi:hypothetical protein SAY87_021585 [Trapa incisa]|uniref:Filament-like plant protein 4 n=1 Tax=Trapa incisa TaxID=236973 RepID=A0AAN7JTM8_9MYRT|nr:hypothetical protein SAY87_021585 [Trapa incisa]